MIVEVRIRTQLDERYWDDIPVSFTVYDDDIYSWREVLGEIQSALAHTTATAIRTNEKGSKEVLYFPVNDIWGRRK